MKKENLPNPLMGVFQVITGFYLNGSKKQKYIKLFQENYILDFQENLSSQEQEHTPYAYFLQKKTDKMIPSE